MGQENLPAPLPDESPRALSRLALTDEFGEERPSGPGLKRYIAAVLYYRWVVLVVGILGMAGAFFGIRFLPLTYQAEATLWLSVTDQNSQTQGPIQSSQLLQESAWIELLRSYTVLDYVANEQRLYLEHRARDADALLGLHLDSMFAPGAYRLTVDGAGTRMDLRTSAGILVESAAVGDSIGGRVGFLWRPEPAALGAEREVKFSVVQARDASKTLSDRLQTRVGQGGNFLALEYTGEDPERVASVLNTLLDRYVDVAADLKRARFGELRDILERQMLQAEDNLKQGELELESFRVETITLPTEPASPVAPGIDATRNTVMSSFFELKINRDQLQQDAQAIARAISMGDSDRFSVDALSAVLSVQQSPELSQALNELTQKRAGFRALLQLYTVEHQAVQRAQADVDTLEDRVIPQLAQALIAELDNRVAVLDGLIGSASSELRAIPPRAIEEARRRRTVEIAQNLYNDLRQRYESARLGTETTVPDVRILDRATVPQRPTGDKRLQMLAMVIAGSFALGIAVAILLERLDPKIRYPEQVSDTLRLMILGAVPDLTNKRLGVRSDPDRVQIQEAFRGLRLSVRNAHGSAGPLMLTITSPGTGDGKTFISSNLALSYADLGLRCLVIDGDTRRGDQHHVLGMDRKPGLTDYLAHQTDLESVLRRTSYDGIDLITCGSRLPNSPELLSSSRMGDLLAQIRSRYDVILIDSPPLGAGVDPLVLASLSGNMLLVMRTGRTDLALAEAKLQMVDRLPVRVLGAVMNGVSADLAYRYYSYLPGYETGQEEAGDEDRLLQPV